jgi:hypothetical protein
VSPKNHTLKPNPRGDRIKRWRHRPETPGFGKLKQEDREFEASLAYILRSRLKKKNKGLECGLSSRMPALQARSPEFNLQSHPKKEKK